MLLDLGQHRGEQAGPALHHRGHFLAADDGAADGDVSLHQVDLAIRGGGCEGRLHACDAATDHQHVGLHVHGAVLELLGQVGAAHRRGDQGLGLVRGALTVRGYPGAVLADVGHLHLSHVGAGVLGDVLEGLLVHLGRARAQHDAVGLLALQGIPERLLAVGRAEQVVALHDLDAISFRSPALDGLEVQVVGDVGAAPAQVKDGLPRRLSHFALLHAPARAQAPASELVHSSMTAATIASAWSAPRATAGVGRSENDVTSAASMPSTRTWCGIS